LTTLIRLAESADLPLLADLWQAQMTLLAQDSRFALAENGRERWMTGWQIRLNQIDYGLLSALADDQLIGYAACHIQPAPLGLQFATLGVVLEMALDAHRYHGGAGRELVAALLHWFLERDVEQIIVAVPRRAVVEQAFWRGLGATEWIQWLWMK
jgi:GNAT superfamily N-acetyltransferase